MRILFISPHLSIAALDDHELRQTTRDLCAGLERWIAKTSPTDLDGEAAHRISDFLHEADNHVLTVRLYTLHASMECEYRFRQRAPEARVLDRVPFEGIGRWPIHLSCIGRTPAEERAVYVEELRERAGSDDPEAFPMWSKRPVPEWLSAALWDEAA